MAFWRKESDQARLDLAAGDTELADVLADGPLDLARAVALLDGRPLGSETRAHAVHAIGLDPRLDRALPPDPEEGSATALIAVVRRHDLAWEARGRGVTSFTTEDQFADFHDLLADVEGDLLRLTRSRPGDDVPYWHLLSCARGLERENDVVQARFDALREINPTHRKGYSHVLRRLAPKWGGTMDGMLGFAWESSEHTSAGSVLHGVVAEALVEGSVTFIGVGRPDVEAAELFWKDPRVRDQVQMAFKAFTTADDADAPWRVRDLNTFLFAAAKTRCVDEARTALELLGGRVSAYPWRYFTDDEAQMYAAVADGIHRA
jgi:hypothetical protein